MIFVTVGTHEQQFNRLIKCVDELKKENVIREDVIMQTGFSTYKPRFCASSKLFSYAEMQKLVEEARIVITHGGPSSFIMPLQLGKIPIVVPRKKQYEEHVNDHQLDFCKAVEKRMGTIIVIDNIEFLKEKILNYDNEISKMPSGLNSNNAKFNAELKNIVRDLFEEK